MIVVKVMAGLGNQMFQYATARALAHRRHTKLVLDISSYDSIASTDTPRKYELPVYRISASIATIEQLSSIQGQTSVKKSIINQLWQRLVGENSKLWSYHERTAGYNTRVKWLPDNSYLVGWWQCAKYFESIRSILLKEFEPVEKPSKANAALIRLAMSRTSVAIHVRRGDYVSNKNASVHHGLAPIDYYSKAIQYFEDNTESPLFFVFSDDLEWCKKHLPLPEGSIFVDGNGGDKAYEDIRIMKHCTHGVVANSSFSWWGAWLNDNPGKIIIAPKIWFQDEKANKEIDIIPDGWVRF